MNRRGFIRGLLASVAGTEAVVRLATPEETQALAVNEDVLIRQPEPAAPMPMEIEPGGEVYVQTRRGEFVPIGLITDVTVNINTYEIPSMDGTVHLMPGRWEGRLRWRGQYSQRSAEAAVQAIHRGVR